MSMVLLPVSLQLRWYTSSCEQNPYNILTCSFNILTRTIVFATIERAHPLDSPRLPGVGRHSGSPGALEGHANPERSQHCSGNGWGLLICNLKYSSYQWFRLFVRFSVSPTVTFSLSSLLRDPCFDFY